MCGRRKLLLVEDEQVEDIHVNDLILVTVEVIEHHVLKEKLEIDLPVDVGQEEVVHGNGLIHALNIM